MGKKLVEDKVEESESDEDSDIARQIEELKNKQLERAHKAITKKEMPVQNTPHVGVSMKGKISQLTVSQKTKKSPEQLKQERISRLQNMRTLKSNKSQTQEVTAAETIPVQAKPLGKAPLNQEISQTIQNRASQSEQAQTPCNATNLFREKWTEDCRIININVPTLIPAQHMVKRKKYQIRFTYLDKTSKLREATVRFGSTEGKDYVDKHDEQHRKRNETKYGDLENPLDSNYWRYWLCNTGPTVIGNYCQFIQSKF